MFKRCFLSALLLVMGICAASDLIYQSDFRKPAAPFVVWGKVRDNVLTAGGRYDFAGIRLEPSDRDIVIEVTLKCDPETAFGMQLYSRKDNRIAEPLTRVVWGVKPQTEKKYRWTVKSSFLKGNTYLIFYCIGNKKGDLEVKNIRLEKAPESAPRLGNDILVYQSDFKENPAPLSIWGGKCENGTLSSNGKYAFAGMILPASKQPFSISCTVKCDPGTALGVILCKLKNGKTPGARIRQVTWNRVKPSDFTAFSWMIPAKDLAEKSYLLLYSVNPKYGNVTLKDLRIERIADKLEIPQLKKKGSLSDRFTEQEAEGMLRLADFRKFPAAVKTPAPEETDIYLGITPETLYGVAVLAHPGQNSLKSTTSARDDRKVFKDDSVEFFISAPGKVRPYFHFAFNAAGAVYDAMGTMDSWNSGFSCKSHSLGRHWTAIRFELPLKDIGYGEAEHNVLPANWGINFCRNHAGKQYSTWGKVGSGFHDPAGFNRFHGFGKTPGIVAAASHFSQKNQDQEIDEKPFWQNEKKLFSELFTKEDNPYKDFGSYIWLTPVNQRTNTQFGLQHGIGYSHADMLETLRRNKVLPFCRYGEIPLYADWAKKNGRGLIVYFRYYRSDSFAWDLSDDSTMKRKLEELDALLTKYEGIIWGVELGDEALEVILGFELIKLAGKRGGATKEEVARVDKLIREKFGFGKYGLPKSLNAADQPFHQLASRRFILSKLQQMQKGIWEVCRKHRGRNGKKVLSISPSQRADNILTQQSRFGEWCDIMTTQIVPMGNPWRQTIAFNTKLLADLSGKTVFPCAHVENYHHSYDVETTAAHISEIYRGGGTGMQLFLSDCVGMYNKIGSNHNCRYGHLPRWNKIMEESKRFSVSRKLRFPKPEYAFFLSNDSAQSNLLFTEKQCEWLFNLLGPGAGSSFRFISDVQLTDGKIELKDFPFVVIPAAPVQNPAVRKKVKEYVEQGGTVICFDPKVFEFTDDGNSSSKFREQLFGVKTVPASGGEKLSLKGYAKPFPLIGRKFALIPESGVEVIGKSGKDTVVTVRKYSSGGKAVMVSIGAEFYYAGQSVWTGLAKSELKKLGASVDCDIWKFTLPYVRERKPVFKGVCLTGNHAYRFRDKFIPGPNRIPPGATYQITLAPDGGKVAGPVPFGKGNLMNRLEAATVWDIFLWQNASLVKAGKLSMDQFADTWTRPDPFEICFDFGEKIPVSTMKIFWNGELPDLKLKFDDGTVREFNGETAGEVGEMILDFATKTTSKLTLCLGRRTGKLTISEIEIWSEK